MLSPKQIGTICFAIFSFIFPASLFATDIPSSASTADCKHTPLQVYSGQSNLEAGWQANTIQLHWYNGDDELTVPSASQSCVYDGTLTPPTTIPTKTGYTFKGWRVKQTSSLCTLNLMCGVSLEDISDRGSNDWNTAALQWKELDGSEGSTTAMQTQPTVSLNNGEWVTVVGFGTIRGIASCNNTPNRDNESAFMAMFEQVCTKYGGMDSCVDAANNGTMSQSDLQTLECIFIKSDNDLRPANTFNSSSTGQYCWCKMESYTPNAGSMCNVSSMASWVRMGSTTATSNCLSICAHYCASNAWEMSGFRSLLFTTDAQ